ncbi:hypothetical protein B0O99DRAFT_631045 [Bisporella sp. PMI_857]|nr:hypothetical protein B0O99DRAFT_631045 [Bisporella sp. PMI_857]
MEHNFFLATLGGGLHLAPCKDEMRHVLDIAIGTVIWATEFGRFSKLSGSIF